MKKISIRKMTLIGLVIFASVLLMVAWYYALQTLVNMWWIVAISLLAAVVLMPACKKIWKCCLLQLNTVWRWGLQLYVVGSLAMLAILCTNYVFAGDFEPMEITIQHKYREQHRRMRRVSRMVYTASGEVYYDYFIVADFGNGLTKSFYVPLKKYNSLHIGDICEVEVAKGLFGLRVVRRYEGGGFLKVLRQQSRSSQQHLHEPSFCGRN